MKGLHFRNNHSNLLFIKKENCRAAHTSRCITKTIRWDSVLFLWGFSFQLFWVSGLQLLTTLKGALKSSKDFCNNSLWRRKPSISFLVMHLKLQFPAILFSMLVLKPLMKESWGFYSSYQVDDSVASLTPLWWGGQTERECVLMKWSSCSLCYTMHMVPLKRLNNSTWLVTLLWLKVQLTVL